jgi:hypothetical protein
MLQSIAAYTRIGHRQQQSSALFEFIDFSLAHALVAVLKCNFSAIR